MKKISIFFLAIVATLTAQNKNEQFIEHSSLLRVPFNHNNYSFFEKTMTDAEHSHTSVKPYLYNQVHQVNGFEYKKTLLTRKKSWAGRKLWNEHLYEVRKNDFWFHIDFLLDVSAGIENVTTNSTIENTRILKLEGQLGKKIAFSFTGTETQAKFPQFMREYILINQPEDAAGLIPGRGKGKGFGDFGFDYGISTGYVSFQPNKFMNVQFGHGQNFIGNGYRSLLLSDVAAPYTYGKITTTFGNVQYTNLWTWLRDFNFSIDRVEEGLNAAHKRKYGIFHHLSWNVNSKLNLGFFEGIISDNSGSSGTLQAEYFNPIIFYKNVEFANGEDGGSGAVGLDTKFKFGKGNFLYGQFFLDEFTAAEFFKSKGYWANKYGFQLGVKFLNPFGISGLALQAEFNKVTPFTYAHEDQHNYAHFGQSLGHLWGANFWEAIFIARYKKERWSAFTKVVLGKKGFDFFDGTNSDSPSYGGNIFTSTSFRNGNYGHDDVQGNIADILNIETEISYLINPANNLRLFASALLRNFNAQSNITKIGIIPRLKNEALNVTFNTEQTQWFLVGIKADLFNNYKDF